MRTSLTLLLALGSIGCHLAIDAKRHTEQDAGVTELDAGPMDAGPMDAARPDAGPMDAGRPDASAQDAGRDAGSGIEEIAEIVGGASHTCLRTTARRLFCWGRNDHGQVGVGLGPNLDVPVEVPIANVVSVALGTEHTCAALGSGEARCWGANDRGQLGNGSLTDSPTPVTPQGLGRVSAVGAGDHFACAIHDGGRVSCWGANDLGALADGTRTDRDTPTRFGDITDAVEVGGGDQLTCVRRSTGSVSCAGWNPYGQVGNGTTGSPVLEPADVVLLSDAMQLTVGQTYACATRAIREVVCWGHNFNYQHGIGTNDNSGTPRVVPELMNARVAAAGSVHGCAVGSVSGVTTMWCWGENDRFQLATGNIATQRTPVIVGALTEIDGIAAGNRHTCAWSGALGWCWGLHVSGQCGVGEIANESSRSIMRILWP